MALLTNLNVQSLQSSQEFQTVFYFGTAVKGELRKGKQKLTSKQILTMPYEELLSHYDIRRSEDGYPMFKFVGTGEVIDHENEVIDLGHLLSILHIMKKQGSRIQGYHSNQPGGRWDEYETFLIKNTEAIWFDIAVYDDYETQQNNVRCMLLDKDHEDAITGISIGGFPQEVIRECDGYRCWDRIKKYEGWEFSFVKEPGCQIALRFETPEDRKELLRVVERNPQMTKLTSKEKSEKQKLVAAKQHRELGKFAKAKTTDCENCPPETPPIIKKCETCGHEVEKMEDYKAGTPVDMEKVEGEHKEGEVGMNQMPGEENIGKEKDDEEEEESEEKPEEESSEKEAVDDKEGDPNDKGSEESSNGSEENFGGNEEESTSDQEMYGEYEKEENIMTSDVDEGAEQMNRVEHKVDSLLNALSIEKGGKAVEKTYTDEEGNVYVLKQEAKKEKEPSKLDLFEAKIDSALETFAKKNKPKTIVKGGEPSPLADLQDEDVIEKGATSFTGTPAGDSFSKEVPIERRLNMLRNRGMGYN